MKATAADGFGMSGCGRNDDGCWIPFKWVPMTSSGPNNFVERGMARLGVPANSLLAAASKKHITTESKVEQSH